MLRMEDIDKPRSRPELAESILHDLRWLGLDWDEGPDVGGKFGPYVQSEREEYYEQALEQLVADGRLYPCYCSRAELAAIASAPHGLQSEGPAYPGLCRVRPPEELAAKAAVKKPSLRFTMPDKACSFVDGAMGLYLAEAGAGGDFVVKRADGVYGYQLAVVVDDAAMGITDVIRGADLLDSTPRQLALYEALGLPAPHFAHVPLLLDAEGRRLAKRDGGVMIASIREAGVSPETVTGWLAYWSGLLEQPEPTRPDELIARFDWAQITREPTIVTAEALRSLGG